MGEDVVRDDQAAGLDALPGEPEVGLVLGLGGVEEDDVEDVVDPRQNLERIALDEVGPALEAGLANVLAPARRRRQVSLEGQHATAQVADAGAEPDARVAAAA